MDLPIQEDTQYFVVVDGIGGYDGPFNVSFTSQPIATTISWAEITSQDGFSVKGNLTKQGLPLFRCVDDCPEISCDEEPDVVWRYAHMLATSMQAGPCPANPQQEASTAILQWCEAVLSELKIEHRANHVQPGG